MSDKPLRIASLLPSATEILCFIGGGHLLVGRSHEDNFPQEITHLPFLTGQVTQFTTASDVNQKVSETLSSGQSLYTIDEQQLCNLNVDLILTQDLCKVCAIDLQTVERIAARLSPRPRILCLNPQNLDDVLQNLMEVGEAVGLAPRAKEALAALHARLHAVDACVALHSQSHRRVSNVAFIEWSDPLYVGGHWTPQLIERAGGCHPLNPGKGSNGAGKSFAVTADQLVASDPELIIVCCCGLDLAAVRHEAASLQAKDWWPSLRAVQAGRVALVDGDAMFNRPGPRLVDALEWLCSVLTEQPDRSPPDFPVVWLQPGEQAAPLAKALDLTEIEEIHRQAVAQGQRHYIDPETGYTVFTQLFMIDRGWCCGSGCRHCPYGHQNLPAERRGSVKPPLTVPGTGCPRQSPPRPNDV